MHRNETHEKKTSNPCNKEDQPTKNGIKKTCNKEMEKEMHVQKFNKRKKHPTHAIKKTNPQKKYIMQ